MTSLAALTVLADAPAVVALGWTLVHFLWQGLVLGLVFALAHRSARRGSPALRYWIGMATLAAMLLSAVVTFSVVYEPASASASISQAVGSGSGAAAMTIAPEAATLWTWLRAVLEPLVPWTVAGWLIGVGVNAFGLLGDFRQLRTTLATARPLPSPWPAVVDRIRRALGVRRVVRVLESTRIGVPIVVGWLRPVIIIPPSALLGLSPRQLELIIGHELAHVARFDYLFNLAQLFVETVLFYHPAVHFVGRAVRLERENCCDDAVVERTGETLAYAKALTEIEGLRCSAGLRPAAAATGGDLKLRITRLVAMPDPQRGAAGWLAAMTLLAVSFGTVVGGVRLAVETPEPAVDAAPLAPSLPVAAVRDNRPLREDAPLPPATVDPRNAVDAPGAPVTAVRASGTLAAAPESPETNVGGALAAAPVARPAARAAPGPAAAAAPVAKLQDAANAMDAPAAPPSQPAVAATAPRVVAPPLSAAPPPAASPAAPLTAIANVMDAPAAPPASEAPPVAAPPVTPAGTGFDASQPAEAPSPPAAEFSEPAAPAPPGEATTGNTTAGEPVARLAAVAPKPEPDETRPVLAGGEVTRSPAPNYPRRARTRGIEGQVTVRYQVDTGGRTGEIEVLSAEPAGLFEKAVTKAVRKWRHEPFTVAGQRVTQAVTQTFDFGIRREEVASGNEKNTAACRRVTGSRLCRSGDAYEELGVVVVHNPL